MTLFAKMNNSTFVVIREDMCYLDTYNGTSWYLIINVTSKCLYTRCYLAYLSWCPWVTFIWSAILLEEDYANCLKQHEDCCFEEHRSNPTSDMKSLSPLCWNAYLITGIWNFLLKHAADISLHNTSPSIIPIDNVNTSCLNYRCYR